MATVVKDLGAVTAYAYAVAGGYSGTEAEFEALLGNIAEDLSEIENLSVTVTTLPAGSSATASYNNGVLSLGIPKGDKGDKGDTGATGATGPQGIPGDVANLASAYSTSSTYGVGDYCIYNSQLYRCTTPITTAEAWTAAHWTAAALGDDVGDLKSALTTTNNCSNDLLYNLVKTGSVDIDAGYTQGGINWTTGKQQAYDTRCVSRFIILPEGAELEVECESGYVLNATAWYETDGTWIGSAVSRPANAALVRVVISKSPSTDNITPEEAEQNTSISITASETLDGIREDLSTATTVANGAMEKATGNETVLSELYEYKYSTNKCDMATVVQGYITTDGSITTADSFANYYTSDYIPVESGKTYKFVDFNNGVKGTDRKGCNQFDENKNVLSNVYQNINGETYITITAAQGAAFIRVSSYKSRDFMLTEGETVPDSYSPYFEPIAVIKAPLSDEVIEEIGIDVGTDILNGKKWVVCGDSFSNYTDKTFDDGTFAGKNATYPRLIAERCNMNLVETFFIDGRTLAFPAVPGTFVNSLTCPTAACYYQNIPADADYITFYIGINDEHHATGGGDDEDPTGVITLGTIDDNTTDTYYGAWNVVLNWLITNRPNAHIGIIVTNGLSIAEWRTAQINIANKYGISYIDMNGNERTPAMLRTVNPDIPYSVKSALIAKWAVDPTGSGGSVNTHPNWKAHLFESTFIENFLRGL